MNPQRPAPEVEPLSAPFFDGLAQGVLLVQHCTACATVQLAQRRCTHCGTADFQWRPASGLAVLYSYAIVHMQYHVAFKDHLPYNIAIVELDEGPQLYANLIDVAREDLQIGMRLQVRYDTLAGGVTVPLFAPLAKPERNNPA